MHQTTIFCCLGSLRRDTDDKGMTKMIKSLTMLTAEEKYHIGKVERHLSAIPGTMVARGTQATDRRTSWTKAQIMTITMSQRDAFLTAALLKMRRNWRRKDILTTLLAKL